MLLKFYERISTAIRPHIYITKVKWPALEIPKNAMKE